MVDERTIFDSKNDVFLSNDINKQRFVNMISDKCRSTVKPMQTFKLSLQE